MSTARTGGGKYDPEDIRFHTRYRLFRRSASNSSMVCPSTPGAPWLALTFLNASHTACFEIANGFSFRLGWLTGLLPATGRLLAGTFHR
jgi:hypothetical protein